MPLTLYFDTGQTATPNRTVEYSAATRRYTAGPSVEWHLNQRFGFELDMLFKRMGYVGIVNTTTGTTATRLAYDSKGDSWDFPLLAKYRFARRWRPYVAAGGTLRYVGPVHMPSDITVTDLTTGTVVRTPFETSSPSDLRKRFYPGLTVAGGIELGGGRLHVLPEFRYTHWTANIAGAGGVLRFTPNQAEVLVGLLW